MGHAEHKKLAGHKPVACAVITCSDTRTPENDASGAMIRELLTTAGHVVRFYAISMDEPTQIDELLTALSRRGDIQAVIFNGGTGISRRDNTFDAVSRLLTKTLPGFGEIFRLLSYQRIGPSAMLSRATAGILVAVTDGGEIQHKVIFSIPGSPNAVELAMNELILPELSHLVWETLR